MTRTAQRLSYADLPRESLLDGTYQRAAVRGDHSMVTFNWLDPAMPPQPPHTHDFDQISLVPEGTVRFTVDGQDHTVSAGEVLLIPAGAAHTGIATGDRTALNIDVYAPPRPDYLHLVAHQVAAGFPAAPVGPADQLAIERLLLDWARLLDAGRWHDTADLLTDDAVVTGLGPDRHGPDGWREWADARAAKTDRRTRHLISNIRCSPQPDGTVTSTAHVTVHVLDDAHPAPHLEFLGEYADTVRRTPDGWRFTTRHVTPMA